MFSKERIVGTLLVLLLASVTLTACSGGAVPAAAANTTQTNTLTSTDSSSASISFSKDVMPILSQSCVNCHGVEKVSKGLDLTTYDKLMAGSQNGAMVLPGDSNKSKFIQVVLSGKMPKRGPKLTAAQIQVLVDWVKAGAPNN